jgi:hypothetical protein
MGSRTAWAGLLERYAARNVPVGAILSAKASEWKNNNAIGGTEISDAAMLRSQNPAIRFTPRLLRPFRRCDELRVELGSKLGDEIELGFRGNRCDVSSSDISFSKRSRVT